MRIAMGSVTADIARRVRHRASLLPDIRVLAVNVPRDRVSVVRGRAADRRVSVTETARVRVVAPAVQVRAAGRGRVAAASAAASGWSPGNGWPIFPESMG